MATAEKNKPEKGVLFFVSHKAPFRDHVYHAFHHTFTTKTPRLTTNISKTPSKNAHKAQKSPGNPPGLFLDEIAN
jgi:hypothetical protein